MVVLGKCRFVLKGILPEMTVLKSEISISLVKALLIYCSSGCVESSFKFYQKHYKLVLCLLSKHTIVGIDNKHHVISWC